MHGIQKMPTGIAGFDHITGGGLPRNRTTLLMGGPGTGKTIFALQTMVNGARRGEAAVFIAFEENSSRILSNVETLGWNLGSLRKKVFFLDSPMSPEVVKAGEFDLNGMLAALSVKIKSLNATRVVFDGLDVLLELLDDPTAERRELYRIHKWLSDNELTGLLTIRMDPFDKTEHHRFNFIQFVADCVVLLEHEVEERVSHRHIRITKYRGSRFSENAFPLVIGPNGIDIGSVDPSELPKIVSSERIPSGVDRLDSMLAGGYLRGSSVLITGVPGTAKTSMCGAFIAAVCERGEQALYLSFDESGSEIARNLMSIGINLETHIAAGRLKMYSARVEARSAEEHLITFKALINDHQPRHLVVDPLSAIVKAGGTDTAMSVAHRLIMFAKSKGITILCTSLSDHSNAESELTPLQVSTIADTWIHLSYVIRRGERNRALTIVKSRGTAHSNQVRELLMTGQGLALSDVYAGGGEVLMGTARWEREFLEQIEREKVRADMSRKRRELELAEAESRARIDALEREIQSRRVELSLLAREQESRERSWSLQENGLLALRNSSNGHGEGRNSRSDAAETPPRKKSLVKRASRG